MKYLALALLLFVLAACGTLTEDGTGLLFHTADPRLDIGFRLLQPEVIPAEEVGEIVPEPPLPAPCDHMEGDVCQPIKGNIGRTGKIFHVPGGANYDQVLIDESKGEAFFRTEQEAIDAGFRKSSR